MGKLTHFNKKGLPKMVDVSDKDVTTRVAIARGSIKMATATMARIKKGGLKKGDVLSVADVAGVMGAKRTSEIIPMCHPLPLSGVDIEFSFDKKPARGRATLNVTATTKCVSQTGVEMEALTAVATALLTVYDMCKAIDRAMTITNVELIEKKGGKSGTWKRKK